MEKISQSLRPEIRHERMVERFRTYGTMENSDLLELLLYHAAKGKDVSLIARRLTDKFPTFKALFSASAEELESVEGVDRRMAQLIMSVGGLGALRGVKLANKERTRFARYTVAGQYFTDYFATYRSYGVAVLLLDNSLRMLDALTVYDDADLGQAKVKPSAVVSSAVRLRASAVVTAHFHPNGPLFPSDGDRVTNAAITKAFDALGIVHLEHFVVCGERYIGIMHHLKERFAACADIYEFLESKELAIANGAECYIPEEGEL